MKKLLKGLFAFVLAASCVTCLPTTVNAEVSVALIETGWDVVAYIIDTDTVSEYASTSGSGDGPASYMLDNNTSSWWHSNYSGNNGSGEYSIVVNFNEALSFDAVQMTGRPGGGNGTIGSYEIYYINSDDATTDIAATSDAWVELVGNTAAEDGGSFTYALDSTLTATHVKIDVHDGSGGYGSAAELDFLKNYDNYEVVETSTALDSSAFTITASGTSEGSTTNLFDGNATTFWCSQSVDHVNTGDAWLQVDLGDVETINRVDYTKRYFNGTDNQWKCTGNIREYVVEVKEAEADEWTVVSTGDISFDEDLTIYNDATQGGTHQIEFDAVKARYIRIRANSTYHWQEANLNKYMTVADLAIYSTTPGTTAAVENYVSDGTNTEATFSDTKATLIKALTSGTIEVTYRVSDATLDKDMTLFAISDNTSDSSYYSVWVNPGANQYGVSNVDSGGTTISRKALSSSHGVNANNTDWHTITVRNTNTDATFTEAGAVGIFLSFDGGYVSGHKWTGTSRAGFATLVSNATSVTTGYVDLSSADEQTLVGEISKLSIYSNVLSNAEVAANHTANINAANGVVASERWVKNYLQNKNFIFESTYDSIGNEAIEMVGSLTSENYLLRYVEKDVLSVKAQAKQVSETAYTARFVTSVASLNPEAIGFEYVIMNGDTEFKSGIVNSTTVFTEIEENNGDTTEFTSASEIFSEQSQYFATFTLSNIPSTVGDYTITLKPYWIPYGETENDKVYGVEKTYTLSDLFETAPSTSNE